MNKTIAIISLLLFVSCSHQNLQPKFAEFLINIEDMEVSRTMIDNIYTRIFRIQIVENWSKHKTDRAKING